MSVVDTLPDRPPPPEPRRPRVLLVGTALGSAAAFMAFAGLLGIYLAERGRITAEGRAWLPEDAQIGLTGPNMMFFTLILSVFTFQWAIHAVGHNDRQHAFLALGLTILFGGAVINSTTYLYGELGLGIAGSVAGLMIFAVTGAHLVMIMAGLVFATVMTIRTLGGEYAGHDREGLVAASVFWYATVAVYAIIWYAIYVTK